MSERQAWLASGWRWLPVTLLAIVVDQWTKALILSRFALHESIAVLPVLDIIRARNFGAAFSFLDVAGGAQRWGFTALAVAVSVAILYWLRQLGARTQWLQSLGLSLILGGAIGNVIDRLRHGHVVDFIAVHWKEHYFPAFNVADSCITVGAGLLLLDALLDWMRSRPLK